MRASIFDGMSIGKAIRMTNSVIKHIEKERRFPLSNKGKRDFVDLIEATVQDEDQHMGYRLKCVELGIKMEAMNQTDERLDLLTSREQEKEAITILVLPNNGSEVQPADPNS